MSPEMLAYRKAAKVVVLLLVGVRESASLLDRTAFPPFRPLDRKTVEGIAVAELAGHAAEQRFKPKEVGWPIEAARTARQLLRPFVSSEQELQRNISKLRFRARKQIEDPVTWRKIRAVAGELLTQTRLSAADVRDICARVEESPQ
jgi:hypothetical protein